MGDDRWQQPAVDADGALSIAIRHISPAPDRNAFFGDYFFAKGLADGFLALGHRVRVDARSQWDDPVPDGAVVITLRGGEPRPGPQNATSLLWYIYPDKRFSLAGDDVDRYAHVFFASSEIMRYPEVIALGNKASTLYQAFDPAVMYADPSATRDGVVFIGSNHRNLRNKRVILNFAKDIDLPVNLWGRFWGNLPAAITLRGNWLGNRDVGETYRHSEIVLCDHAPSMRVGGFASNRIFDALACGAAVVSDDVPSLPAGFERFVERCGTLGDFRWAIETIRAEDDTMKSERLAFAQQMLDDHTFEARAKTILETLARIQGSD